MKTLAKINTATGRLLILLALGCFALCPVAQAVSPAPDGGYSGGNTAEGQNALLSLTTGFYNTGIGIYSLLSLTDGSFCTGVGAGALLANTADENTATGAGALLSNSTGGGNTANGTFALFSNTTGNGNTAVGALALFTNIDAFGNTAIGASALENNDSSANGFASFNTAVGDGALGVNVDGGGNTAVGVGTLGNNQASLLTAVGVNALFANSTGTGNTAVGALALASNLTGSGNTAVGDSALQHNNGAPPNGSQNTAVGIGALRSNTDGNSNTAVGDSALSSNTTGNLNEAMGVNALASNDSGFDNIAIGDDTLSNNVSGSHNIIVGGFAAGFNIVAGSNNIYIGPGVSANGPFDESDTIRINDSAPAAGGATSQVFFAGIDGSTVGAVNAPVLVNPNGQLGTGASSARFKKDIDPMGTTSEAIFSLKPVTFHYKGDTTNTPQCGLIAEEVAKVNPALILTDKEGKPYSVRYDQVNAMLLNEFLKEHKKVGQQVREIQEQRATISELKKSMETVIGHLKEQDSRIQKVSDQIEIDKAGLGVVKNGPRTLESNTSSQ